MLDLTIECSYSCRTRCRKTYTNFYNIRHCIVIDRNSDRWHRVATPTAGHLGLSRRIPNENPTEQISWVTTRPTSLHVSIMITPIFPRALELRNTSISKTDGSRMKYDSVYRLVFPVRFSRSSKKTFRTGRREKCRARPSPVRHWVPDVGIFGCEPEKVGSNSDVVNQWFQNWNWIEEHQDDIKISAIWRG